MLDLIDNYTAFEECIPKSGSGVTFSETTNYMHGLPSIIFQNNYDSEFYASLNRRAIQLLNEFSTLKDNWDGELSKAPAHSALLKAKFIVKFLQATGQQVFHVAPGPRGEIMVDIRNKEKSIELIFYPDKVKYVTFSNSGSPQQGLFESSLFPELLGWLNA